MIIVIKKICALILIGLICIFSIPLIIIVQPISLLNRRLSVHLMSYTSYAVWKILDYILSLTFTVKGKNKLEKGRNYLFVTNHIGSFDFMIINRISREINIMRYLKYIIKEQIKYIPIFYQICVEIAFIIIRRSFKYDKKNIVKQVQVLRADNIPASIVLYPEGTRFTPDKHAESLDYAKERGLVGYKNLLYPRYKGFKLLCDSLRFSSVKEVADVIIVYKGGDVPPLWKVLLCNIKGEIHYDVRVIPIMNIIDTKSFLLKIFARKDDLIDKMRKEMHCD